VNSVRSRLALQRCEMQIRELTPLDSPTATGHGLLDSEPRRDGTHSTVVSDDGTNRIYRRLDRRHGSSEVTSTQGSARWTTRDARRTRRTRGKNERASEGTVPDSRV